MLHVAQRLAEHLKAAYVRIDTVEQGLRDLCNASVEDEGYRLSYRILEDNLKLGISAIADSCNPVQITRIAWQGVATGSGAHYVNIEVSCSDPQEHRRRVENRQVSIANLRPPTWEQVQNRHYEPWADDVICIDTAGKSIDETFVELLEQLEERSNP